MTFFAEGKIHYYDKLRSPGIIVRRQYELLEMITNGKSSKVEFKTDDVHPNALAKRLLPF